MLNTAAIKEKPVRQTRVKKIAHITDWCTGCGVCQIYCKFNALHLIDDSDNYPLRKMTVDSGRCVGCGACVASGPQGLMLTGCPWNAIRLLPI